MNKEGRSQRKNFGPVATSGHPGRCGAATFARRGINVCCGGIVGMGREPARPSRPPAQDRQPAETPGIGAHQQSGAGGRHAAGGCGAVAPARTGALRGRGAEVEPPITPPWFPAWMVVEERGFGKTLAPRGGESEPERAFDVALALVRGGTDRQDIENRRALQALHPGLLQRYLDALDR